MSNIFNLLSEEVFAEALDTTNAILASIASQSGGITVSSWSDIQQVVRLGLASKVFAIGDQLTCTRGDQTLVWDVIGIDHDVPCDPQFSHSMTLQLHDCIGNMQFDAPEALFYAESALPASNYYFVLPEGYDTAHTTGRYYYFQLANPVPAGGVIVLNWANNTIITAATVSTYPDRASRTAIETVPVYEGTASGHALADHGEIGDINRARFGSNRWETSAIRQWLNSSAAAGSVWTPQTNFDRPPYWAASKAGFLSGMDADFVACLGKVSKITAKNAVTDGGGSETSDEKFFLISRGEAYGGLENRVNEGDPYPYYANYSDLSAPGMGDDSNRIKYHSGSESCWWTRSCDSIAAASVRRVYFAGLITNYYASGSNGVAPACCII